MTSDRRALRAAATRTEVLRAARLLFADRGYANTNVRDIAAEAGVSPQTVYDSVGSKWALVARLNDQIDEEAGLARLLAPMASESRPRELVAFPARGTAAIVGACGDIVRTLAAGARAEAELAGVLEEGLRRHRRGMQRVAQRLADLDALPAEMSVSTAAETLAVLTDAQYALLLIDQYGWSLAEVERWMADTCRQLVLRRDRAGAAGAAADPA